MDGESALKLRAGLSTTAQPFEIAASMLEACEIAIARGRTRKASKPKATRLLNHMLPMELAATAARSSVLAFLKWLAVVLGGAAVAYGLIKPTALVTPQNLDSYCTAFFVLVTLCFVLGRPSTLSFSGWSAADLLAAKERCSALEQLDEATLPAVQFFVQYAEALTRRRIAALWWIAGATWATSVYFAQKGFEGKDGGMIAFALIPMISVVLCAGLIASYARAVNQVHGLAHGMLLDKQGRLLAAAKADASRTRHTARRKTI